MNSRMTAVVVCASLVAVALFAGGLALANGGPFVVSYPGGDPAAKGVLARLDPSLKPRRETRLRVVKEDLKVVFLLAEPLRGEDAAPLADVTAVYTIENPTAGEIEIDFGFPILRGMYVDHRSMVPRPDVSVQVNGQVVRCNVISNSIIYGIIRERARQTMDGAIARDGRLSKLIANVRNSEGNDRDSAHTRLAEHLTKRLRWNSRDAALMVEYASLDFGENVMGPGFGARIADKDWSRLVSGNLGALRAISEQKATQFFAQLASLFDRRAAGTYESIFSAWGGDVRERSVDLRTGRVRPREITLDVAARPKKGSALFASSDPTVYARLDYFDPNVPLSVAETDSCKNVLKNLPVVFTFAPMNLLHYNVKFPPKSTQTIRVSYKQFAYADTRAPESYQLCYVVHPASLWKSFGPINLEVAVPAGVRLRASVPCRSGKTELRRFTLLKEKQIPFTMYHATLPSKKGELFVALDSEGWKRASAKIYPATVEILATQQAQPKAKK